MKGDMLMANHEAFENEGGSYIEDNLEWEWVIGYRNEDGEIRISPSSVKGEGRSVKEHFEYLCGPWRKELENNAASENLKKSNWFTCTLAEKKREQFILMRRRVSPYEIIKEAPPWE